ncbi:MAG: DegV family protein [Christensenellales bacterium]
MGYKLFSDVTADVSEELMRGMPEVELVPMQVELGGENYIYGPGGDLTVEHFYAEQRAGKFASTSQINPMVYRECFEKTLKAGEDILYLCFSSGLSSTLQSANLCAQELREEYPERKLIVVDTLCAAVGEAMLVREAARKQQEGLTIEELAAWVEENRLKICHWFTVDSFDHLKHGGRVSAAAAAVGTMLQIKPLLHVDEEGKLRVAEKPRGRKQAIRTQVAHMKEGWTPEMGKLVVIGHGDCPDDAEQLRQAVLKEFPDADIRVAYIGPVIGAHTGPGMLALIYWGTNR